MKEKLESGEISEAQFREAMTEKVVTFFERTDVYEKCQDLEVLSFEEFRDFIIRINGLVRDIPIKDRKADGEGVFLGGSIETKRLPLQKDKEGLLLKAYEAISKVDKHDLKYFVPLMINAIHLFRDANGRTARIFNLLLSDLVSKEDFYFELEKALHVDGRYKSKNISPEFIEKDILRVILKRNNIDTWRNLPILNQYNIHNGLNIHTSTNILEKVKGKNDEFLDLYCSDKDLCFLSALNYLKDKDIFEQCLIVDEKNIKTLSIESMNNLLNDNDWDKIVEIYYNFKKEEVEIMIDIFVNSEDYHVDDLNPTTLKDLLINRVNR